MPSNSINRLLPIEPLRLAYALAKRDLKNRYANSYGGIAWNIGVPLLYAMINAVVFSILMNGRMGANYGDIPFVLFYFVPFSLWAFFSEVVGRSTGILREYGYLINKIAFPFWVLPLIPIASALLSQGVLFFIIGGLMIKNGIYPANTIIFFIPIWLVSLLFTLGVSYFVSALAVYVPDLAQVVPVILNIAFWLTPILYPASLVEDHGALWTRKLIMDYNPFYYLAEMSRQSFFGSSDISLDILALLFLMSLFTLFVGLWFFRKLKSGFADVI